MLDDDEYDEYPPTLRPGREIATLGLFALLVVAFVVWGLWKLWLRP
jgi:hypothetical protein